MTTEFIQQSYWTKKKFLLLFDRLASACSQHGFASFFDARESDRLNKLLLFSHFIVVLRERLVYTVEKHSKCTEKLAKKR